MMISPDTFVEMELQDKSLEEISETIYELKDRIETYKYRLEHPDNTKKNFKPSDDTMLWCNRLYLERAIQAYKDAGGNYQMSDEEKREATFIASLPMISKITLHINGFFYGNIKHIVTLSDNKAKFKSEGHLYPPNVFLPTEDNITATKEDFLNSLKDLYLSDWKHCYRSKDLMVSDGIMWEVVIEYVDDTKIKYEGHNVFPYNFYNFCELMDCEPDFLD